MSSPGPPRPGAKGDLKRYREMRDFAKTPEPSGKKVAQPSEELRFVIQKHSARRLHYDLRLELDGVFKSWAVARGPSLDPNEKRLAIQVEDHPIDYGDFEGIIPKGEYGGGTVMIWDRGIWKPDGDPVKGYEKGHLAFELDGEKLKGRWHLIRTKPKPGDKKQQWLLFKSDDEFGKPEAAGDVLEEEPDSVATSRTMDEIAQEKAAVWSSQGGLVEGELSPATKSKDAPPGGAKRNRSKQDDPITVKGAEKAPFPGFIEPCLALLAQKAPEGPDWLHEIKFDGYRLITLIEQGSIRLMTRKGLDWTERFPSIAKAFENFPADTAIVDGEAVIEDQNGVSSFSALQEALAGGPAKDATLFAFDLLYLDGKDLRGAALDARKEALARLLSRNGHAGLRYSDHIVGDGGAMRENACRLGLEGIVSKRRNSPYRSGRHGDWLKLKCTDRAEFIIGGYVPSTATRNAIGSLALGHYDDGKLIYAGRTGTGFTQKSAQSLYTHLKELSRDKTPFANALTSEERRGLVFVEPKLVAEAEFRGWTRDHRLRHAAFKGLREDKPAEEVHLEEAIPSAGKNAPLRKPKMEKRETAAPTFGKGGTAEFEGVRLTHPDRVLWKEQGLTKLGLAEYYAEVADYILPHIVNRPLALVRCPSGSEGECFFQKHAFAGLTEAVEVVPVPDKNGSEETLVIRDLRGLITLVQANVLEIHPWGARIDDVDHPDRLIFDLDPGPGVEWAALIEGAREVRQRLKDAGVESFVKTTGGKGLHVMANLKPSIGWDELKDFTHRVALAMEADAPAKYVSTMAKKARSGRIFIDYLRNARGATAVAAYSTRARPNAPVSAPIRWDELGPAMSPSRFTVANMGRRLSALKSDPWEGFFSSPQRIDKAALNRENTSPRKARAAARVR
jgi:bifunctional non-homologous end joining protein LigD